MRNFMQSFAYYYIVDSRKASAIFRTMLEEFTKGQKLTHRNHYSGTVRHEGGVVKHGVCHVN